MTIGYITIGYGDETQAVAFYDAVLGAIGYERGPVEGGWAFYGKGDAPGVGLCKPFDGQAARGGNGAMTGFKTDTQDQVKAAYAAALANGGTDDGAPGFRPPEATSGFYGAYVRDAVGNKLCLYATMG
ncbi:VOC family protein [Phenylobacterium sp.]|jgi:catechol 2,3-dioxygenase-like lactoylglutathione lyase family enzyme|uniref:VOC family protein n=1 Tax=Phenylobacterium sp. TaxID=1871053 RepID=UPI002E37746F|nr:VOC family protein [Phenylobacterium sp.]HEX3365531.1 VOC family protein [Phenylobacterium sp.]